MTAILFDSTYMRYLKSKTVKFIETIYKKKKDKELDKFFLHKKYKK
jgi:hypothetical protein